MSVPQVGFEHGLQCSSGRWQDSYLAAATYFIITRQIDSYVDDAVSVAEDTGLEMRLEAGYECN
jgi:hypothetical protein